MRIVVCAALLWASGCHREAARAEPSVQAAHGLRWVEVARGEGDLSQPLPTVVVIHGLGDRPESFVQLLDGVEGPLRIVAPAGPIPWGEGHSWFEGRSASADPGELADQIAAASDRVARLIDELVGARKVAGKPVVTGFSQGGMLSFMLAIRHGDQLAGVIPMGGYLPEPAAALLADAPAKIPVYALHGRVDDRIPESAARATVAALREAGWDATLQTWDGVGHGVSASMRERLEGRIRELTP